MLVSFHESYLLLVQICALFCILTMGYSLFEYLTRGIRQKRQMKKAELLKEMLTEYAKSREKERKKMHRKFFRIMKHPNGLLALNAALDKMGWDDSRKMDPMTRRELCELFTERYIGIHHKEDEAVQGLGISLITRCDASSSQLKMLMLKNLEAKNLLVRIETLRCISAQRNRRLMLSALECIDKNPHYFSNKLLTDTLIEFQGNKKALMEEIWEKRKSYSPDTQVSVIQMITVLKEESFAGRMYELLDNEEEDKEVRLAAIKYFRNVHRPEYRKRLAGFIADSSWEYGAVAANVLQSYDCREIFEELLEGSVSRNWYVRNNCAKTIVSCCSGEQIEKALHMNDRYGRDSIMYAWKSIEKEEAAS